MIDTVISMQDAVYFAQKDKSFLETGRLKVGYDGDVFFINLRQKSSLYKAIPVY